jgi:hypothetical protein
MYQKDFDVAIIKNGGSPSPGVSMRAMEMAGFFSSIIRGS